MLRVIIIAMLFMIASMDLVLQKMFIINCRCFEPSIEGAADILVC